MTQVHCDVWVLGLDDAGDVATRFLTVPETRALGRFRRPGDRLRHAAGRTLLRAIAASRLGIDPAAVVVRWRCTPCGSEEHGKPFVAGLGTHLSVSHSAGLVLVAANDVAPVGVDVEEVSTAVDVHALGRHIVASGEPGPRDARSLFRTWCRKEALVKATGHGLSADLRTVRVTPADAPAAVLSFPLTQGPVGLCDLDLGPAHPTYVAALAILAEGPPTTTYHDGAAFVRRVRGGET